MSKLFVMVGAPGAGKSTYCRNHVQRGEKYISRDNIRFSKVSLKEKYFSKEKEVFKEFCKQINEALDKGTNVYADATHISKKSRAKLIKNVKGYDSLCAVVINAPVETALAQNENRKNTRRYVPKSIIRRMTAQLEMPTEEEGFDEIIFSERGN